MRERVAQPPVNPQARDPELHDFWPPFILVIAAGVLVFCGAWHVTSLPTTDGDSAQEVQLIRSFTSGGLQFVNAGPPPSPAAYPDASEFAAAMDRQAHQAELPLRARYRVNVGATDPCPT